MVVVVVVVVVLAVAAAATAAAVVDDAVEAAKWGVAEYLSSSGGSGSRLVSICAFMG